MRWLRPFDPGDRVQVDPSWPAFSGLVFATTLTDGGGSGEGTALGTSSTGARELLTGDPLESGLIHASATPFGRGRRRSDAASNFVWPNRLRYDLPGDFTVACYGAYWDAGGALNAFTNGSGSNQWRILVDCNISVAYASGSVLFWTYDGNVTGVAVAGALRGTRTSSQSNMPDWFVGVRRGTTLELWRSGVFLGSNSGTLRNVTGTAQTTNKPQLGNGSTSSLGLHGSALIWNRALSPTELQLLRSDDPYPFVKRPAVRPMSTLVAASTVNFYLASDVDPGNWTTSTGSGTLASMLDEATADDTDYIQSQENPVADACTIGFGGVQTPSVNTSHALSYRIKGDANTPILVELVAGDGTTVISGDTSGAGWLHNPAPSTFTQYDRTISTGEADDWATAGYAGSSLRITANP